MFQHSALLAGGVVCLIVLIGSCKKDASQPTALAPPAPQLMASPTSASMAVGTSQNVSIGGGTPPYVIATPPSAIAAAVLFNPDSLVATLRITGVSVASVATSVTMRDNTPAAPKTVVVPASVH